MAWGSLGGNQMARLGGMSQARSAVLTRMTPDLA
jgi:hypothetical protein